ncbi:CLIP domain-containing serine protease 2-like isoform X1 [Diaphorina citri]|uniref:CLIP domain-containing serine protease 2-like isoform X1 n=1 Tax=Diaphorina citri TaxID=121845 RepID=A0A3Q0JAT2_DIACI|nr:CLIP domain-containing serine protease 2-like isoform X1 [Diaphorina citri]
MVGVQGLFIVLMTLCFVYDGQAENDFDPEQHKNWHLLPPKDECGLSVEPRIIGGYVVKLGSQPWIARIGSVIHTTESEEKEVNLRARRDITFYCGGSLINQHYVVTAAHCFVFPQATHIVRLGEQNVITDPDCQNINGHEVCAPPVQDIKVIQFLTHENYTDSGTKNDIALLRLEKSPEWNGYVHPVCLPYGNAMTRNFENENTIVAGWGVTEDGRSSLELLAVQQKVFNSEECKARYQELDPSSQICVGGKVGKDACKGDSGGPLTWMGSFDSAILARNYLIGLVSYGPTCGTKSENPGVYTRMTYFLQWILDHLEDEVNIPEVRTEHLNSSSPLHQQSSNKTSSISSFASVRQALPST